MSGSNQLPPDEIGYQKPMIPSGKRRPKTAGNKENTNIPSSSIFTTELFESAAEPLQKWQFQIMDKLEELYGDLDKLGGADAVIESLILNIENRYDAEPAQFVFNETTLSLPLKPEELDEFFAVNSIPDTKENREAINKAYFQHPIHTAYRYFLIPNPWMAPEADGANGHPAVGKGYSDFQNHKNKIAYFWLAASDPNEAKSGHLSVTDRQGAFIAAIAEIARDKNKSGTRDDLKGDKPACRLGVVSGFFSAVVDHSAYQINPEELLELELAKFVKNYYVGIIQAMTVEELKSIDEGIENCEFIEVGDIPKEKKLEFIENLANNINRFDRAIKEAIVQKATKRLEVNVKTPGIPDFYKFYSSCGLQDLVAAQIKAKSKHIHI